MFSANLSAEVKNVAADLDRDVRLYVDVLSRLAASLPPDVLADPAQLNRVLDQFSDSSAIIPDTCFVADRQGIITAGYPEHAVRVGASVGISAYFRELIATGKPVIGAHMPATAGQPAVPIAVPLRDAASVTIGALVGSVRR